MRGGATGAILRMQVVVEQRMYWRNRSSVLFSFIFPLLMLVCFVAFVDAEVLVPGVASLVVMSVAFQTLAIQLSMHREQGVLKRTMTTPLAPSLFIAGKTLSIAIVVLIQVALIMAVAGIFLDLVLPKSPVLLVGALIVGVAAFTALGTALASAIPNGDAAPAVVNAVFVPTMLVSGVFYEMDRLPAAARGIGELLPLAHLVDLVGAAWVGPSAVVASTVDLAALGMWGACGALYSVRSFRWEPVWER